MKVLDDEEATIGEYWYDGDGKRVKKYVPATGETPAEITIFVYDAAGKQIAEYSTIVASTNDAKTAYLTTDHLGSPRINTDAVGAVISRHDYHPFGEEITTAQRTSGVDYEGDTIRKKFTGYERDGETELDFAQARYFNSGHGRFSTPDPLQASANSANPQSMNRYVYALNRPLILSDPSGLAPCGLTNPNGTMGSACNQADDYTQEEFNRALARYIFEKTAEGYIVDAGIPQSMWAVNRETMQQHVAIVAFGQPGTGDLNVGTNFQRAAAQVQANLESAGWRVINAGELSSLYGFQNVLDMAARERVSAIYIFSHGAPGAIDLGDGPRNDTKDVTLTNVDQLRNNGFTASISLKACNTGFSDSGIAAALSRRLGVAVEAPTTGMSFSPFYDKPGPSDVHPNTGPTYMLPEGTGRLVVCNNGVCRR